MTAFIIFPVKYNDELERSGIKDWDFGWAYGLGWAVTVLMAGSSLLLWLDKDADEIIFREKTSYNNDGIEEVCSLKLHYIDTPSCNILRFFTAIKTTIFSCRNCAVLSIDFLIHVRTLTNEYPKSMFGAKTSKRNVYPCKPQFNYIRPNV